MRKAKQIAAPILEPYRRLVRRNRYHTTDVFFVGFPRSGNTWTRFLVGKYLQLICDEKKIVLQGEYDFWGRCPKNCLGVGVNHNHGGLDWYSDGIADLRYENKIAPYLGKKIVFISRYPMDSMVSSWLFAQNIVNTYEEDLSSYLGDPVLGLERTIAFNNLWAQYRTEFADQILLWRYEDLKSDTFSMMKKLIDFLEWPVKAGFVQEAIKFASFDNMKRIQTSQDFSNIKTRRTRLFKVGNPENPEAHHVRKGKVGGYRDYLSDEQVEQYEERIGKELDSWFGYQEPPRFKG